MLALVAQVLSVRLLLLEFKPDSYIIARVAAVEESNSCDYMETGDLKFRDIIDIFHFRVNLHFETNKMNGHFIGFQLLVQKLE